MKQYLFKIDKWQMDSFFSPVRTKVKLITLLVDTVKLMLINCDPDSEQIAGEIVLVVSKMSRLFYFTDGKYFSINFPFLVQEEDGNLSFSTKNKVNIDNLVTSNIKKILLGEKELYSPNVFEFLEPIEKYLVIILIFGQSSLSYFFLRTDTLDMTVMKLMKMEQLILCIIMMFFIHRTQLLKLD